jgi:predicted RNase H-like HicB family nuclease
MLYPAYVHPGDERHAHGVTIPDFPGCFSAADTWEDLPAKIQEAAEVYCEDEDMEIPEPTPWETLTGNPDLD